MLELKNVSEQLGVTLIKCNPLLLNLLSRPITIAQINLLNVNGLQEQEVSCLWFLSLVHDIKQLFCFETLNRKQNLEQKTANQLLTTCVPRYITVLISWLTIIGIILTSRRPWLQIYILTRKRVMNNKKKKRINADLKGKNMNS